MITTAATCEGEGVRTYTCTVCQATRTETLAALGHSWGEGAITAAATCTQDGVMTYTCQNDSSHTKTETIPATGHSPANSVRENEVAPTHESDGSYDEVVYCLNCGSELSRSHIAVPATGHNWDGGTITTPATCETAGVMTYTCADTGCGKTRTEAIPATGHDWDNGAVTTPATCTEAGIKTYTCKNDAGHTKTEAIPALGHAWDNGTKVEATCLEEGYTLYTCARCGETKKDDYTGFGEHKWDGGVVTTPATCEAAGVKTYSCSLCGATKTEVIPATGHDWDDGEITTPATCTEAGVKTFTCKNDASHTRTEAIEATGHDWGEGVVTTPATCTEDGVRTFTCKNDPSHTKTEVIPATDHSYSFKEIKWDGFAAKAVYVCDKDATHVAEYDCTVTSEITKAATCTEAGVKTYTAAYDGHTSEKTEEVKALGHDYQFSKIEWDGFKAKAIYACANDASHTQEYDCTVTSEVTKAATCEGAGTRTYTATYGGHSATKDEAIGAIGHEYSKIEWDGFEAKAVYVCANDATHVDKRDCTVTGEVTKAATCTEGGVKTYTAAYDGHSDTKTEAIPATGHTAGAAVEENVVEATCTQDGSYDEVVYCSSCQAEMSRAKKTTSALGHNWDNGDAIPSTCKEQGYTLYTCLRCTETDKRDYTPLADHTWGEGAVTKAATCTEAGTRTYTCTVCGETKDEDIPATGHNYEFKEIEWDGFDAKAVYVCADDAITDKRDCTVTSEITKAATCTEAGTRTYTAAYDGHSDTKTEAIPATGHTAGAAVQENVVEATCTEAGSYDEVVYCSSCQAEMSRTQKSASALGHDYQFSKIEWDGFEAKAVYACSNDASHTQEYDCTVTSEITKAATCEGAGTRTYTATYGGHSATKDEAIGAIGHEYEYSKIEWDGFDAKAIYVCANDATHVDKRDCTVTSEVTKAATCTEDGVKTYTAAYDGHTSTTTETIPATGHNWDDGVINTPATCTKTGVKTYTCKNDSSHTKTEDIPVIDHTAGNWEVTKEASCTEAGTRVRKCTECGATVATSSIPKLNHSYSVVEQKAATCTEAGYIKYKCSNCGDTYSVSIAKGNHNYSVVEQKAATCTEDGYIQYKCSSCGHVYTETIAKGNHDYQIVDQKAATYTEAGYIKYECSSCYDVYTVELPQKKQGLSVLLVEDSQPWNSSATTTLLNSLLNAEQISSWDKISASQLSSYDLSDYSLVYIANDQTTSTYSSIKTSSKKIESFAEKGGVVIYGSADHGWKAGDISYVFPNGVGKSNYYSNYNYIVDDKSPIVTGELSDGVALTQKELYSTYCSHTYFTNLPEGSNTILIDQNGKPTLVEYSYGAGYVILSGITWEYSYDRNLASAKSIYDDLFLYALTFAGVPCEHEWDEGMLVSPTCGEQGYTLYTCSKCGKTKKADFVDALPHEWDDGVVMKEATCTEAGVMTYTCKNNENHTKTEAIEAIGHKWDDGVVAEPTCTEDGYTLYTCSVCKETKKENIVAAKGHTPSDWVITKAATCTEAGTRTKKCTTCGETVATSSIPKLNHNFEEINRKAATCTEEGYIQYKCSNCGATYSVSIAKGNHNYEIVDRKDATCTEDGYIQYKCSNCGDTYKETIAKGSHDYQIADQKAATYEEAGYIKYECSICHDAYTVELPQKKQGLSVLLVEDSQPWNTSSNTTLLNYLLNAEQISSWDKTTSSQLSSISLSDYSLIYIANDQATSTYSNIKNNKDALESYVNLGGAVIYGSADSGWKSGKISYTFPSGASKANTYSNYNYIADSTSPIVTAEYSDKVALTNSQLYSNYCSHTYFTNLPEGSNTILIDQNGNPTLAEYSYGAGYVILSGLTWEYSYTTSNSYSNKAYDDLFLYALTFAGTPCEHEWDEGMLVSPTCGEQGYTLYTCAKCGKTKKADFVDALPHDWDDGVVTKAATCTDAGVMTYTCKNNENHTKTEVIEAIGHKWDDGVIIKEATCTEAGAMTFTCNNDSTHTKTETIAAKGHKWDEGVVTKTATCEEAGVKTFTCLNDSSHTTTEVIEAIGHKWNDGVVTKEPTCTQTGAMIFTCLNDASHTKTEDIAAKGHNFVDGVCTVCGTKESKGDVWDGSVATSFASGSGTESDPYVIATGAQLAYLAKTVNNGTTYSGKYFVLANDIDLNNIKWTPIGKGNSSDYSPDANSYCFSGIFNGNYHSISRVNCNISESYRAGLFGALYNATVKQLKIVNASITLTSSNLVRAGVIAGTSYETKIDSCSVSGQIYAYDNGNGNVHSVSVGGIVGAATNTTILNASVFATLEGVSGQIGNPYVGGLVGSAYKANAVVTNSIFVGSIKATSKNTFPPYVGGIIGCFNSTGKVTNSIAIVENISSSIKNIYSIGYSDIVVTNCYYNYPSGTTFANSKGTSTSLENLQSETWAKSNLGWDFENTWTYIEGNDYPVLKGFVPVSATKYATFSVAADTGVSSFNMIRMVIAGANPSGIADITSEGKDEIVDNLWFALKVKLADGASIASVKCNGADATLIAGYYCVKVSEEKNYAFVVTTNKV